MTAVDGEFLVAEILQEVASLESQIKTHNEYVNERLRVIRKMLAIVLREHDLSPKDSKTNSADCRNR